MSNKKEEARGDKRRTQCVKGMGLALVFGEELHGLLFACIFLTSDIKSLRCYLNTKNSLLRQFYGVSSPRARYTPRLSTPVRSAACGAERPIPKKGGGVWHRKTCGLREKGELSLSFTLEEST